MAFIRLVDAPRFCVAASRVKRANMRNRNEVRQRDESPSPSKWYVTPPILWVETSEGEIST